MFSQLIAAVWLWRIFPMAVPALYSDISGIDSVLSVASGPIVFLTSVISFVATLTWWDFAVQDYKSIN